MQCYLVRKCGPGKLFYLDYVVKKFHEIIDVGLDVIPFRPRRRSNKLVSYVMGTAARGDNDIFERRKVTNKQLFCGARVCLAAAICHRLPATGLIERIFYLDTKLFEQLQSGDANFWIKDVDVTRNHQTNAHFSSNQLGFSSYTEKNYRARASCSKSPEATGQGARFTLNWASFLRRSALDRPRGSAPDIAGQGIANPIAQVWAGAMMLEHLGRTEAAGEIVAAIEALLASTDAPKTPDLGGNARTADVDKALLTALPG